MIKEGPLSLFDAEFVARCVYEDSPGHFEYSNRNFHWFVTNLNPETQTQQWKGFNAILCVDKQTQMNAGFIFVYFFFI